MIKQLPEILVPDWLAEITQSTITIDPFPLTQVLEDSLYYPSSGFDGDPVKYLSGNILSFIYVDYRHSQGELEDEILKRGFRGYECVATRSVTERELIPRGWNPRPLTNVEYELSGLTIEGVKSLYKDLSEKKHFCSWSIFQRGEDYTAIHGPSRFSYLYICAEGVAAFQALYLANSVSPKAVAVIQPGHKFGGNWTNFEDHKKIFARSVLGNPQGRPEILLYGGTGKRDFYREPCWPSYTELTCFLEKTPELTPDQVLRYWDCEHVPGRGSIGVWVEKYKPGSVPESNSND